jgi:hypothetical protein
MQTIPAFKYRAVYCRAKPAIFGNWHFQWHEIYRINEYRRLYGLFGPEGPRESVPQKGQHRGDTWFVRGKLMIDGIFFPAFHFFFCVADGANAYRDFF